MATSVDHQYHPVTPQRVNGVNGVVKSPFTTHRSDSPVRNCNFNLPGNEPFPNPFIKNTEKIYPNGKKFEFSDSEDDDDENEINGWNDLIKKGNSELEPSVLDSRDEGTADHWIERNSSLIRLTGKHPFNSEPPLTRLMHHGFLTPVPLHYVRNHGPVPRAKWEDWTVEVTGLVKKPTRFTMDQLVNEFQFRELPVTLVCAGNRRKEQNMVKQSIGFNWGSAAVSTSVWRGVPLRDVLKRCGIMSSKKGALNVCFEGAEDLPGGGGSKYGTSVRKELALDPARDIMLAYMQNGELLAPDHGFPVRMIIPGFIGGRMVKWLKRIVVTTVESDNYYHYKDNRVLPSHVDAELANSEAWWYKPEHIINDLNINSVITTPCHEEILPINAWTTQRPYTLRGYAYSGGGKKVTRVEVTMDGGETWQVAELDIQEKPSKYGKYWCWCFWSLEVEVLDLLGAKEIAVRAWDETLNTQPEKLIWNLMGKMNNCWFRVKSNVCKPHKGEIGIVFEHPTQPGNRLGGWMARERDLKLTDAVCQPLPLTASTNDADDDAKVAGTDKNALTEGTADDDSSTTTTDPVLIISPMSGYRINISQWEQGMILGRGSFGTVYEGISSEGIFFAVKEVSLLEQGSQAKQSVFQLEQEIDLLSQFEHENIVRYLGTEKADSKLYIFLELVTQGSLASLYGKYQLRDSHVSAYTRQILTGLKYLHDKNVVHRDIKCANILVASDGAVKLADFGLAKAARLNDLMSCKGTAFWMAPEVIFHNSQGYGLAADIWSLGCTVLEMLTRHVPYHPCEFQQALFKISQGQLPPIPDTLSCDARDFILQCLRVNADDRPTAAKLLDHQFVQRPPYVSLGSDSSMVPR